MTNIDESLFTHTHVAGLWGETVLHLLPTTTITTTPRTQLGFCFLIVVIFVLPFMPKWDTENMRNLRNLERRREEAFIVKKNKVY